MVGPRFEQTAEEFQPRPLAAIELIAEEPIRLVEDRVAACDGGTWVSQLPDQEQLLSLKLVIQAEVHLDTHASSSIWTNLARMLAITGQYRTLNGIPVPASR